MEGALLFYLYEEVGGESLARSMCGWGGYRGRKISHFENV